MPRMAASLIFGKRDRDYLGGDFGTAGATLVSQVKWCINPNAWRNDVQTGQSNGSLIFGILRSDGEVSPHPPVQRATTIVMEALLQHGYELVEWNPPPHSPAADALFQLLGSTAGQEIRDAIKASGEPPIPHLIGLYSGESSSSLTSEFWKLCEWRERHRNQYHEYWKSTSDLTTSRRAVDGVIMPVAPHAAPAEGSFKYHAYSAVPSFLDYTVGVVPVTFADRFIDHEVFQYTPMNDKDGASWRLYDKDTFDGAPVGIQVMGQRLQEEKVVAMMEAVQAALQQYQRT